MAIISGYISLQTAVTDYLARGDLATFVPNFIQNFEERFYRQPANFGPWMETAYSTAMASQVSAVPTGFLAWKAVQLATSPARRLTPTSLSQLYDEYPRNGSSGVPQYIARNGSNFEYGPFPSSNFTVSGSYYQKPTLLRSFASDAAAHYLIVNAPDMLLYGALLEAEPFLKEDDRLQVWQGFLQTSRNEYRDLQAAGNFSGGPMMVRVG